MVLERPLHLIVGKGGVGKTTVAAALAVEAARRKRKVLLVEMDVEDRVSRIFGVPPATRAGAHEISPGITRMSVEGRAALEEYLGLIIPIRRVLKSVFESSVYQHFVAAAPGLKELMTVGKVWYEVDQGKWDTVIVDCPATGHALQYLRMPKAAYEAFSTGLVHREAKRVWDLLSDPVRTAVSIVTTAEEMPVNETLEICRQLRNDLHLPEGWLFVNRFHAPDFTRRDVERAKGMVQERSAAQTDLVREVLARGGEEVAWAEINARLRKRLAAESRWPLATLPFLFREEFGLAELEALVEHITEASTSERPKRSRGHA